MLTMDEIDGGTKHTTREVHTVGAQRHAPQNLRKKKAARKPAGPKRPLSQNPDAIRKRKSRADPKVRAAERRRANAAYKMKSEKKKKKGKELALVEVNTRDNSLEPFGSRDDADAVYRVEYKKEIIETLFVKHTLIRNLKSRAAQPQGKIRLVNVSYDSENRASARSVKPL